MREKFFRRNFANLLLVMLLPVSLLGTVVLLLNYNYINRDIDEKHHQQLRQTQHISQLMFQAFDTVNVMVSSNYSLASALRRMSFGEDIGSDDMRQMANLGNTIHSVIASGEYIHSVYIYMEGAQRYYSSSERMVSLTAGGDTAWLDYVGPRPGFGSTLHTRTLPGRRQEAEREILSVSQEMFSGLLVLNGTVIVNVDLERLRRDMQGFTNHEGQQLYLFDGRRGVCLTGTGGLEQPVLELLADPPAESAVLELEGGRHLVTALPMQRPGWVFVALTPTDALYALPRQILAIMLCAVGLCLCVSAMLSRMLARRNYDNIRRILDAFELAEQGAQLPAPVRDKQDIFGYIIQNIIHKGILQRYMEVQISEKKYKMQALVFAALQYQINPHFLINTIRMIYWKVVEAEGLASSTSLVLENLLDFTGYLLEDPDRPVTLGQEIAHTKSYADILLTRYAGEMAVEWSYPQKLLELPCCRLIIQPLLENAVYHGLRPRRSPHGRVRVKLRGEGGLVVLKVIDNGVGMSREKLAQLRRSLAEPDMPHENIGLNNPHRRIVHSYGMGYGLTVFSKPGLGTCCTIRFPAGTPRR